MLMCYALSCARAQLIFMQIGSIKVSSVLEDEQRNSLGWVCLKTSSNTCHDLFVGLIAGICNVCGHFRMA